METLHSLEGCQSEIHKISNVKGEVTALGISVTLLAGLGSFEALADKLDLFFGFTEGVRSK